MRSGPWAASRVAGWIRFSGPSVHPIAGVELLAGLGGNQPRASDGLRNFLAAGPGLGGEDAGGDREALLDKVPDVTPLRATGLLPAGARGLRPCARW